MIAVSGLPSRSRTCCQVASFEGSGVPCHVLGEGATVSVVTAARGARLQPPSSTARSGGRGIETRTRARRVPNPAHDDDRTIGRHAATQTVPDHPERAQRRSLVSMRLTPEIGWTAAGKCPRASPPPAADR
jgi:hypothetical protein